MNKLSILFIAFLILFNLQTTFAQQRKPEIYTGGVVNGITTFFPQPEYPQEAKEQNISGTVSVRVSIDEEGKVTEAKACSGNLLLRPEAEKAALKAKFKQTKLSGVPVKVSGILVYNFKVEEDIETEISDEITLGKPINLAKPKIPSCGCKWGGNNIVVMVQVEINKDGKVILAQPVSGHPLLKILAKQSAEDSTFSPTKISGKSVKSKALLIYTYDTEKWITKDVSVKSIEPIKEIEKTKKTLTIDHYSPQNVLLMPAPKYPAAAKLVGVMGEVGVGILIDENGNVEEAKAVSGHPLLRISAEKAAKLAKFKPITLSSIPVKARSLLVYRFNPFDEVEKNVDNGIIIGKALNLPKPGFPSTFNGKIEKNSSVLVEIEIDENGNVISANAISEHPILRAMSVAAARRSKFSRTTISDVPVKAKALLTYEYILSDELIVNIIVNGIEAQQ